MDKLIEKIAKHLDIMGGLLKMSHKRALVYASNKPS